MNQKWFQQNSKAIIFKKLSCWYLLNFIYKIIEQVKNIIYIYIYNIYCLEKYAKKFVKLYAYQQQYIKY